MKRFFIALLGSLVTVAAWAHSPICSCTDNRNGTVTCEGGFTDGSKAAGTPMRVVDANDRVLLEGKMDADSRYTFRKPEGEYHVVFDAGKSHIVMIYGGDID